MSKMLMLMGLMFSSVAAHANQITVTEAEKIASQRAVQMFKLLTEKSEDADSYRFVYNLDGEGVHCFLSIRVMKSDGSKRTTPLECAEKQR